MVRRAVLIILMLLMILLAQNGCFSLKIEHNVDYPAGMFARTLRGIETIDMKDPGKKQEHSSLNFLVYDGSERKLISFSIGKVFLRSCFKKNLDVKNNDFVKHSGKYVKINLAKLKDFQGLKPGLIMQVEDFKTNTHLLIWLD